MPDVPVNTEPVLPGFHSDPTVCRVGDDFYLACSSFEYFPGAPVHHSRDLRSFELIGHVITAPEQTDLAGGGASGGIYGSTLRHHDGLFHFATTNVNVFASGQLIFTAPSAAGPWSAPVAVPTALGIDPDLAWDDDGTCYLTWCAGPEAGIRQLVVDPATGAALSEARSLWSGTGMRNPEGPHLYHRGDWWYLLIAEGGTDRGHSVSVARSRRPDGPFEPHPANPLLTHRSTDHPVQSVGHADLIDSPGGDWFVVFHGTRPAGQFPEFPVLGRETFRAAVEWQDDWPSIVESELPPAPPADFTDDFSLPRHPRWVHPGSTGGPLLTRVKDRSWTATAELATGRLLVRLDDKHWYAAEAIPDAAYAVARIGPLEQRFPAVPRTGPTATLRLRAVAGAAGPTAGGAGPDEIHVELIHPGGEVVALATFDGRYVSTEVAGGFTGRMVGIDSPTGTAAIRSFSYRRI